MMMNKYLFYFLAFMLVSIACLSAAPRNDTAWLGYLHLPAHQKYKKHLGKKITQPDLWKKWKSQKEKNLSWLPKGKEWKYTLLSTKFTVPLTSEKKVSKKHRRRKR